MKLMISQPMNGKAEKEIRFEREPIVRKLLNEGHDIVDTIFAESPQEAQSAPLFYLSKSIEAMSKVDGVVFMPGWEHARGCAIEHAIAVQYGLFVRII